MADAVKHDTADEDTAQVNVKHEEMLDRLFEAICCEYSRDGEIIILVYLPMYAVFSLRCGL